MNVVAMPSAKVPSMRDRVSQAEWDMRVELAALYRVAAYMGLEDLTANHFAARVPDAPNHFLIKPTALLFSEVTASNLCCYDENRELVYETEHTSSPAGPPDPWIGSRRARGRECDDPSAYDGRGRRVGDGLRT